MIRIWWYILCYSFRYVATLDIETRGLVNLRFPKQLSRYSNINISNFDDSQNLSSIASIAEIKIQEKSHEFYKLMLR